MSQKFQVIDRPTSMVAEPIAATLMVAGASLAERREELREKFKAGELHELVFDAVVYRDGPNSNHTRFRAVDLSSFAASFEGQPFLRNHDVHDVASRDGTVIRSALLGNEFRQSIRLSTQRGIKDFLEGVIDRFSIGWYFEGVECSICSRDWFECEHYPGRKYEGRMCEIVFVGPRGKETSAVNAPAVQGTRVLEQLCQLKERGSMEFEDEVIEGGAVVPVAAQPAQVDALAEVAALRAELDQQRIDRLIDNSGLTAEGKAVVRLASKGHSADYTATIIEAQRKADGARLDAQLVHGIRPSTHGVRGATPQAVQMITPMDRVQSAWNWMLGARDEVTPPPSMRSVRDLYLAITGDFDFHGRFNPEWAQLAAATTTTLAGMTVNALNKVIMLHYDNMLTYRWYEPITHVAPHDGTTQNVQLITMDGLANLPTVSEGQAYTEASVGDAKEALSFSKKGVYVGITLEAIRRSDIQRLQALPRQLVQAAIRTRSAAVSLIFTQASGTGPTLADDTTVLFHSNHGNVSTTAFSGTAWAAARSRIWEQNIPGTSKPLGLWPQYVLVPIELYDSALIEFGYGDGDVGRLGASFGQTVNPYAQDRQGDPRPVPIPVPDWTDATDWAYIVDPRLHPVIHMAYANAPQGGVHAMPEIFEVASETSGLMFSNDTLPVKIRDWFGVQVSTYVGVGKNNVAGS